MANEHVHESHPAVVKRLNRVSGHLRSVIEMIESGKPCIDIAQQLHAVERAVASAKKTLINDHIDHCLVVASDKPEADTAVQQFRAISKYL